MRRMQEALRKIAAVECAGVRLIVVYIVVFSLLTGLMGAGGFSVGATVQSCSGQTSGDAVVYEALSLIERGQWHQAQTLLSAHNDVDHKSLNELKSIVARYNQLSELRGQKQTQAYGDKFEIYSKSAALIEAADPNSNYQTTFGQLRNLWREATPAQKTELTRTKVYQMLMSYARQQADQYSQSADWSNAWSKGAKWLVTFEPENSDYRRIEDQVRLGDAVQSLLETDPCQDKSEQYAQITRVTAYKAFGVLSQRYVEAVDFQAMADKTLQYSRVLTTILKNDSIQFACQADPAGFESWDMNIEQLVRDFKNKDRTPLDFKLFVDFSEALLALNQKTLKLPEGAMVSLLTEAAISTLDPYTKIVWPYEVKQFEKDMTGQFGGIGIRIKKDKEKLIITSLIEKTPAMDSGLQPDDIIVAVDGELTDEMSTTCAVQKISGPIGTSVTLSIQRGDEEKERMISIIRNKIVLPAVEGAQRADNDKASGHWDFFLDKESRIGYLRLNNFTDRTVGQLTKEVDELEKNGLAGLILDLRGNGGGLLNTAVEVCGMFVDQGVMLKSKGRDQQARQWKADPKAHKRPYPMVVLIDDGSASASEIVAGVLGSDAIKRAVLVGSRSYGKGTVQEVIDLGDTRDRLKYTSAYYYLPDDKPVKNRYQLQRQGRTDWGIAPHVGVELFNFEVNQIDKVGQERRRLTKTDSKDEQTVNERMLSVDPQLSTALLVLKAKIAVH